MCPGSTIGIIIIFWLCNIDIVQAQKPCYLVSTQHDINIYKCDIPNTNFDAVKANFEIDVTLSQYAKMVLNVDDYPIWNRDAKNFTLLKRVSPTELIYYTEVELPWPIQDRDIYLHLKVTQDPLTKVLFVKLNSLPDTLRKRNNFIRIKNYSSIVSVTPLTDSLSVVNYYLELEPEGSVPASIANLLCVKIPLSTFINFRNEIHNLTNYNTRYAPFVNWKDTIE